MAPPLFRTMARTIGQGGIVPLHVLNRNHLFLPLIFFLFSYKSPLTLLPFPIALLLLLLLQRRSPLSFSHMRAGGGSEVNHCSPRRWRIRISPHPTWTHLGRPSASHSALLFFSSSSSPSAASSPAATTGTSSAPFAAPLPTTQIPTPISRPLLPSLTSLARI